MAVEIEAKMKVADLAAVRERLGACGGKSVGSFLETNTFFDTEDRSMLAADQGLRLRHNHNAAAKTDAYVLTFKGPRKQGQLKSREEIELTVESDKGAFALLEALGYARVLSFQKKRESWTLDGCHVELDEVPHLGVYVEIEGPSEQAVLKVRDTLHLSDKPMIKASYIAMLMTYLQEHGVAGKQVTFASK